MKYAGIQEEELKNKIAADYFGHLDCTRIIGKIDFCVCLPQNADEMFEPESLLWAEAKRGAADIYTSIVQLILTIGKARTFDKCLPPPLLGALDGEKIAFVPYNEVHDIFYQNDFNWNVTPSDYSTKEFKQIHAKVKTTIETKSLLFDYGRDSKELAGFIKTNFVTGKLGISKTKIDKNNFMVIYNKWLQTVKSTIAVDWSVAKKAGIIDGDFYLADLLSQENNTLKEKLFVLLKHDHYELDRKIDEAGMFSHSAATFNDKQTAHTQFWNRYDRPPKEEYWDYIVERRDLLVPQDVRERKGSFFTPQIWVELSQKYLTDVLGENWQDEYTIWDCAAGTGNLLNGLTNKYNIWASTLDKQDVEVMRDRIKNGANLLEDHVFQFDFLNDEFTKLPAALQKIINDPERRKKLVIYINPPYAEATSSKTISNTDSSHKKSVADSRTKERYGALLNQGAKELFVQFIFRAYMEMQGIYIANFSKIKTLQGAHYKELRQNFSPKLEKLFIVPSYTFDNVTGQFPIGFFIWNTQVKDIFSKVTTDIYDEGASFIGTKTILVTPDKNIKDWLRKYSTTSNRIGYLVRGSADVQNNSIVFITIEPSKSVLNASNASQISSTNLIENAIFLSARKVIAKTWINDRDQYLYPNDGWQSDTDFQNDCLAYTLFNNNIQSQHGTNHWIPFTEHEVNAREKFDSNFMTQFIQGKLKQDAKPTLFGELELRVTPLVFSIQAKAVLDAGRALWTHYHQQPQCNVNASLYDIREHFQGRNDKGKMNNKSSDEVYTALIKNLRDGLKLLEKSIEPKIYEYGFLKE